MVNQVSVSLSAAVELAAAQQSIAVSAAKKKTVLDYVAGRLEQLLVDGGVSPEAGEIGSIAGWDGECHRLEKHLPL